MLRNIWSRDIERIFKDVYELADQEKQDGYLFSMIDATPIKTRRQTTGERGDFRNLTYTYFVLNKDGVRGNICPKAFLSIYAIGSRRFERLRKPTTITPVDKRGKHKKHTEISQDIRMKVQDHIKSFPKRQSHYSNATNPNRYYIQDSLSIRRMWLLYLLKHEPEILRKMKRKEKVNPELKQWLYREIFNTDLNIEFDIPRSQLKRKKIPQNRKSYRKKRNYTYGRMKWVIVS